MIKQIATVAIYVANQPEAEKFWVETIGFEVKKKHEMGNELFWLEVGPKGAETKLSIFPKSLMFDWDEKKPSIVFVCEDVETFYEELKEKGVKVGEPPKKMEWGTFTSFKDHDGNEFLLKS